MSGFFLISSLFLCDSELFIRRIKQTDDQQIAALIDLYAGLRRSSVFLCGFPFLFVCVKCLIAVQACPRFPAEFFRLHVRRLFERVSKMRRVEKAAFLRYERYRFVGGRKHVRRM